MKNKFFLEYPMNCSPLVLYPRLSTPGGLSEWFADNVNLEGKYFVFYWDGTAQKADIIQKRENYYIRYKWVDDESDATFFEFRIITDELTGDTSLVVTDFAEDDEKDDIIDLWNSQINTLKHCVGV
ncbi:MAG TPA: START-like domain-containing protein [Bacteroidales bacterium]|nr:START-like domain-containing protein [Bacteroidales bacterium]